MPGLVACLLLSGALGGTAGQASATGRSADGPARDYAPVFQPGPRLSVPAAALAAAVTCTPNVARARAEVALFVPATALDPAQYSWNWFAALDKIHYPYCSVTLPGHGLGDIQVSAEYVVHAIRYVHRISGRRIAVIGHSQGGLEARFALRFWPDTRRMVADNVALATPNHGSLVSAANCSGGACPAAFWQMTPDATFIGALNSYQETFRGISYTNVYTTLDQYVTPNQDSTGSTSLHTGPGSITNVSVQSLCADDTSEHIAVGTSDAVAYALTMDALTHHGAARPGRIPPAVCAQTHMPGVDPGRYDQHLAELNATLAANWGAAPLATAEPAAKRYLYARR
ncbi:esterase/lipase family protein [Plantactinospora sp. WMMB334]|uniref:esterase/lipase family protein n=1 Tax=Plantactinospora sp. WMMB334 TaxID=3404119 RepID=UPI003B92D7FF